MAFVFPPIPQPSVAVAGSDDRLPVRRIFCVGRNYAAHAREMGRDPDREPPFFFTKPADAVVDDGITVAYPPETGNLHYEAELVVALGRGGADIAEAEALDHVWGYAIGNDLTRRDLQNAAKELRRPWDLSKGFDQSAVVGPVHPVGAVGHPDTGAIRLAVNGTVQQDGDLSEMIWSVPEVIAFLSRSVTLCPGDLVMTGTPAGVGAMVPGDLCTVSIEGLGEIRTPIGPRA
ncbi:MAG: FAA hydrolase family protein [Rhodobacteraceae bacterium]|jgi:fumarylpyruvate hydrolase|uniref:Fumarylpyruvate hydrolase n=1 Tax=Salipiger profundus TaxID=1229727 RepID=A0A1U7D6Y3_9RHOB|nr:MULTISPECIES: fumarylacetoacetate hydrolase family protein [Salipiger]APX23820.1 fumarylpyruvate hydrolase [Salipiger profundus]MAB07025.1 FAA hydrolase family protein [Paracoccaceae bacterium]GGA18217.1 fumarylacetoacetate (FAA) hydrolase [Salipiger profundus]SFD28173.1 fumarylpyruvate hydrolase [Salipiger profundus]